MILSSRNSSRYDDSEIVVLFIGEIGYDYTSTFYDVIIEAGVYAHLIVVSAVVKLLLSTVASRSSEGKKSYLNGFW